MKLVNQTRMPQALEDGTMLAAAGTHGSAKEVEQLSASDRARLVEPGHVIIIGADIAPAGARAPHVQTPQAAEVKSPGKGGAK